MAFHCTGRNFELAIAIALTAFASMPMVAVSTVVGPLIEIPVMLSLVTLALRRRNKLSRIDREINTIPQSNDESKNRVENYVE